MGAIESAIYLINHMTAREILPEATKRRVVVSELSASDKNNALLDVIEARIRINPGIFHSLVSLLHGDSMMQQFGIRLLNSYRKLLPYKPHSIRAYAQLVNYISCIVFPSTAIIIVMLLC